MSPEDPFVLPGQRLPTEAIAAPAGLHCYVALGDSFTAGTGCSTEDRWPDRLALSLRARHPQLAYRNLARHGATSLAVMDQMSPAMQLEPDVVTLICGANDVLLSVRPDPEAYRSRLVEMLTRFREALPSVSILTATSPEHWSFMGFGPRTARRVGEGIRRFNQVTREVASAHDVACLDVSKHPGLDDAENFATDGLHPSAVGHEHAAREIARALRASYGIRSSACPG